MDAARSFTYMFKEAGGIGKLIIGGVLLFIPVLGWAIVGGYMIRTMRGVAGGDDRLPDWSSFGDLFVKGLLAWVGALVYDIPGLILGRLGAGGSMLGSLWSLLVLVVLPAALIRYAVTEEFSAFFDFRALIEFIQANLSNYIMAVVLAIAAGIVASFGVVLLIVGVVFTVFWAMLVGAHLYGSVYRNRAEAPVAAGPGRL